MLLSLFQTLESAAAAPVSSSKEARKRKSSFGCSWMSLQLDILLKAVFPGEKYDLLVFEVKKPKARVTQLVSDQAKLGSMTKIMLNNLDLRGIPSPVVCGIIDDGVFIKAHKMQTKSKGKYDLIQLACFQGVRCVDDLARLPAIIDYLNQLKIIITDMQEVIRMTLLKETLPGPLSFCPVPFEWLRPSWEYPVTEALSKRQK